MIVNNYEELYKAVGCQNHHGSLEKVIFKGTNCGASCQKLKDEDGVLLGSIVEGVDGDGTEYFPLKFPFEMKTFWDTLEEVERQAKEIWDETHTEEGEEIHDLPEK